MAFPDTDAQQNEQIQAAHVNWLKARIKAIDPNLDGIIALAQLVAAVCSKTEADGKITTHETGGKHRWTLDKLLKGAGTGSDPTEIDVPSGGVGLEATVAMFQANAATGTIGQPEKINDNNTATPVTAGGVGEYAEVNFNKVVCIKRWRAFWSSANTNTDGRWKIQYYNLSTHAWVDWKTGIPTVTTDAWTGMATETEVLTDKIRFVCTAYDGWSCLIKELEVIY